MKLSIVATLYQSAPHLLEFYRRMSVVAQKYTDDNYEIILVHDGSPDNSLEIAINLAEMDNRIVVIDLSRNFGHHKAIMTGLRYAKGEKVFLIDCDLEEEPEWLTSFEEQLKRNNCDVVYGVQEKRRGGFCERWSGQWFYSIVKWITELDLPENIVIARLMTRRYVQALLLHREREVFLAGLLHITGFKQTPVLVTKHATSKTTYTIHKKISMLVTSITSFSNAPLISIFYMGLLISMGALFYIVYLTLDWLFFTKPLAGWTSVMASVWLLGGMLISFMGIIGIYLSKIFVETKQRPYSIVRQIYVKR